MQAKSFKVMQLLLQVFILINCASIQSKIACDLNKQLS